MTTLDPGAGLTEQYVTLPDGRRLRTVVAGEGPGPLVVFEAGMSAPASSWVHTQRQISEHARTLSYDRAGYGGSDLDPADRTLERIAEDLDNLLTAIGETAPVVLVGHSWGGPILRVFADLHPERVAGLVFVDATIAEAMPERNAKIATKSFAVMAFLIRIGARGLVRKVSMQHGYSTDISAADRAVMERDYLSVQAMRAGGREGKHILAALPTMRRLQAKGTPHVPVGAVQGARIDKGMATLRQQFNDTTRSLMEASPQGRYVETTAAGHLVPQEDPNAVRDLILDVLAHARVPS